MNAGPNPNARSMTYEDIHINYDVRRIEDIHINYDVRRIKD
jgi:hypothetical protein